MKNYQKFNYTVSKEIKVVSHTTERKCAMLRIAICDDLQDEVDQTRQAAELYFKNVKESITYTSFTKAFSFMDAIEKGAQFDIILLDICMPGLLGTEVAKELRQQDSRAEIIFLTTSNEFAAEAFSVNAADYLLKPFTQEQFKKALDKAMSIIRQRNSAKLVFRLVGGGVRVEPLENILYLESNSHILTVHLADGSTFETRRPIADIKADLERIVPNQFQSPLKGYLVNLAHVHIIRPESIEIQDTQIPLGKRRYREFQELYFDFMFKS